MITSPEQKRQLLAKLLQKAQQRFVLSFAQQRLWFLEQLQPGSAVYNIPTALQLTGLLNIAALTASLNQIIQRHEILRSRIIKSDEPFVQITPTLRVAIPVIDLRALSRAHQQQQVKIRCQQAAQTPFDLTRAPLLRVLLLHLRANEYVLLFTMHHIISDYTSMRLFVHELTTIYASLTKNQTAHLPQLPIQYVDYACWQHEWLKREASAQLAYWQAQLAHYPPELQLPTDYPRPAVQTFRGARQSFTLSPTLANALKNLSQRQGVTLFMLLLAAFKILLHRYTQQTDMLVGSTITNRNRSEITNLIGLFVNNLVFRTNLAGNPRFSTFLQQVREVALGAYAHQDLPFEYLVEQLQPERNLSHNPLFQVMFILHNTPMPAVEVSELTINYLDPEPETARFDLSLDMYEASGLTGIFEYNTDLFTPATIERLISHWQTLLAAIAANPEQRIGQLQFLTAAERQSLVVANNTSYVAPQCIHQLITAQAAATPDAIALVCADAQITYRELNDRANQLAHYLQASGVKLETRVGICLERSLELAIALLGVLKAGATYVPLDPAYPPERLTFMLLDASVALVITQTQLASRCSAATCINLDDWQVIAQFSQDEPPSQTTAEHLAYIIYTSGSTGQPKGVQNLHKALVNVLQSMQHHLHLTANDVLLAVTTIAFDIAALELYLPLLVGARVVIVPQETAADAVKLHQGLATTQASVMQATPATWNALLVTGWQGQHLKIICGGEALTLPLAQQLVARAPYVVNVYGPTETTIWSSIYHVPSDDANLTTIPIGEPLANTQLYVLDAYLQPVPIGVPGELYIGGVGVARGYCNRPDLTAAQFIPHPFTAGCGERLYKTGDLVRRADGILEYLGRVDSQVKLRGFRIELDEIASVLMQHPHVAHAVVILNTHLEPRLIAYVVLNSPVDSATLRHFLHTKLPAYMLPMVYVTLDALPLTPNGKIDRRALPIPELQAHANYTAPRHPVEEILAGIWADILGVGQIGIDDNFFELGGHSLLATRVVAQIRHAFGVELPLRTLFAAPTIAELALEIATTTSSASPPPQRRTNIDQIPLSFAQQRQWFLAQLQPDSPFYNISTAVRIDGVLDIARLQRSLRAVLRRHEVLRTAVQTVAGQPVAQVSSVTTLQIPVVDLSELPASVQALQTQKITKIEAQQPILIDAAPLMRVKVLRLTQSQIILLTLHHIAADAWSMEVLVREIALVYQADGDPPTQLPPLSIQYADYAAWQRQWFQGEVRQTQLQYWRQHLQGANALLDLPTDYPRPPVQSGRGGKCRFELSAELSSALKRLSQKSGCTLFMTLLAAFNVLLSRYSDVDDIVVGTAIANRQHAQIEGLIGFFANTLALRTDLSGNPPFTELLHRVKNVTLGAYTHQDLPFEQLVDDLHLVRSLSYTPLFQVMFLLQNASVPISVADINWSPINSDSGTAKFDLTLTMRDTGDTLIGSFEYSQDLFADTTIARMIGHWQTLLTAIVANPTQEVAQLPLLTLAERQQLLTAWQHVEYPHDCIHQLFEAQVRKNPEAIALVDAEHHLTYQQLNQHANQLAHYLTTLGVKPETRVGICVKRSVDMVVGILATLKAGGAYVPLDPAYPQARLQYMLEDAAVAVLIHDADVLNFDLTQINVNSTKQMMAAQKTTNLDKEIDTENLAYVIYTSGSTGLPKGVAIAHRSVSTLVHWAHEVFSSQDIAGVLAATSICFDLSVFELFVPLCGGGKVILAANALQLPELPAKDAVTLINTVPSAIAQLSQFNSIPHTVTTINLAGEALQRQLVQQLQHAHIDRIFNLYGPTEDTTYSTYALVSDAIPANPAIGRAIANTQTYILDRYLQPVPIGVPGELYLSGAGLARGYLNQPELTAAKFIPNLFYKPDNCHSQFLYQTGDRARYLADGTIEYLGRLDNQVKVRGFRIELGEIETALNQHPHVQQAVVNCEDNGNQRLVAYVVVSDENQAATDVSTTLRQFLQNQLPNYMIPSVFVHLEKMPLTPNGKIDRRALVALTTQPKLNYDIEARSPQEKLLVEIWRQLLGVEQVRINDNFFALGGDSILAMQLIAKANQAGLHLSPKQIFQHQTIAELAAVANQTIITAPQGIVTGKVPLTPIQHWFFAQNLVEPHHWNQSILLNLDTAIPFSWVEQSIQHLLKHHDALRLRFQRRASTWEQTIAEYSAATPVIYIDLSTLTPKQQELALTTTAAQLQTSLNLATGLVRVALFNMGNQPQRLLLIVHHLLIDGVSWRILLTDLQTAFQQLQANQPLQLPPKTTSFQKWAELLQTYAYAPQLQSALTYWQDIPSTILPVDYPEADNTVAHAKTYSLALSTEATQALLQKVPSAYQTQINDVLLTALVQTFALWTQQRGLLVELEAHGREDLFADVDLSRTIGWFTTLFPVWLDLTSDDLGTALKDIKEQLRRIPERGISYGIGRYLTPQAQLQSLLAAQVRFNYLGQVDQVLTSLLSPATESAGALRSQRDKRDVLLEINARVVSGQLRVDWTYSNVHHPQTIANLAQEYMVKLRTLINYCTLPVAGGYTPSDFPQMQLTQAELDDLLAEL